MIAIRLAPIKLNSKFYKIAIRLAKLYGTKCWDIRSNMLMKYKRNWNENMRKDTIWSKEIHLKIGFDERMRESRLRWLVMCKVEQLVHQWESDMIQSEGMKRGREEDLK